MHRGVREPYQRKFALHEMAHGWIETNVDGRSWTASWRSAASPPGTTGASWNQRGTEQAAEIVTWGLGGGEISPLLPEAVDAPTLAHLYELLTGREPITPAAR